jgi:hypothetical protein
MDDKITVVSATETQAIYEQSKTRFSGMTPEQTVARIRQLMADRAKTQKRAT